jgi:hypothetical protein
MTKTKKYVLRPGNVDEADGTRYVNPLELAELYGVCTCECRVSYPEDKLYPAGYSGLIPLTPVAAGEQLPLLSFIEPLP